jgi:hypothetical protein
VANQDCAGNVAVSGAFSAALGLQHNIAGAATGSAVFRGTNLTSVVGAFGQPVFGQMIFGIETTVPVSASLEGLATGTAVFAADLNLVHDISGAVVATSIFSGGMVAFRELAGGVTGAGVVAGGVQLEPRLSGDITGTAVLIGNVLKAANLAGGVLGFGTLEAGAAIVAPTSSVLAAVEVHSAISTAEVHSIVATVQVVPAIVFALAA